MIHLWMPMVLAAVLAGAGTYGVLARRNAVLVLIGVELILNAANVMLVALGARDTTPQQTALQTGQSLTLFVITIAAAEICVALAVVLAMFRLQGHIDLTTPPELGDAGDADNPDNADDPDNADNADNADDLDGATGATESASREGVR